MRVIKFKAWDKVDKRWLTTKEGSRILATNVALGMNGFLHLVTNRIEWVQYTGLKDIKGQELCEGDIIKGRAGKPRRVMMHAGSTMHCSFSKRGSRKCLFPSLIHARKFEKIGNIYENPEISQGVD